jgi:hypothetical protein
MSKGRSVISEARALALALERLRRAADFVLREVESGAGNFDRCMVELEAAYASSDQDSNTHLHWAQSVIDGGRQPRKTGRKVESFDAVRKQAAERNIYVHFVNTFEGSRFAVYAGQRKVAEAFTERRCVAIMRRIMREQQQQQRSKRK